MVLILFVLIVLTNVTDGANSPSSGLSKGTLAGLVLGTIAVAVTLSAVVTLLIMRRRVGKYHSHSRRRRCEYLMFVKLRFSGIFVVIFYFAFYILIRPVNWARLILVQL